MKFLLFIFALCLAPLVSAQSIPYKHIYPVYEMTQTQLPEDLASIAFKVSHADPKDTREIKITINYAGGTKDVFLNPDGSFDLPKLDKKFHDTAIVTHNLGKGALTLYFDIDIKVSGTDDAESFAAMCAKIKKKFKDVKPEIWDAMSVFEPRFQKFQIVIEGFVIKVPTKDGVAVKLKNKDKVIKTITNKDVLDFIVKFEDYNANTHTAEFQEGDNRKVRMSIIPNILFHLDKPEEGIVIFKYVANPKK